MARGIQASPAPPMPTPANAVVLLSGVDRTPEHGVTVTVSVAIQHWGRGPSDIGKGSNALTDAHDPATTGGELSSSMEERAEKPPGTGESHG
jgi:hypothetical protein